MPNGLPALTQRIRKKIDWFLLYSSLCVSVAILFHLGFSEHDYSNALFNRIIRAFFYAFTGLLTLKAILRLFTNKKFFNYSELLLGLYFLLVSFGRIVWSPTNYGNEWFYIGFFAVFLIEVSKNVLFFDRLYFSPTLLFVLSFLFIILLGTALLLLPATTNGIRLSIVDALFMATSAVCITGLSVVDVSTQFSYFGQIVLIVLIQLGGLGMLTFTGFFGYFFSGSFSYKNQVMYLELLGEKKIGKVINTLIKIIIITLSFEALGALLIYFNTSENLFQSTREHVFFAIFHAISAFCNAGFSNYPDGLYHTGFQFNYPIQLVIAGLFILGGMGFHIIANVFAFIIRWITNIYKRIVYQSPFVYRAWVINFNSRLIAWTTVLLLAFGTFATFLLEYRGSLSTHTGIGSKLVSAFFLGASPRSSGFNTVDMTTLGFPTVLLIMILMWIGASPGSTGGGIKTTTFAVAVLNVVNLVRGRERIEIFGREISQDSIRRAFSIIVLSMLTIGATVIALSISDGEKNLRSLSFEAISAFTTTGLSLGITADMSNAGKIILACCMFIGRIGTLTLLLAILKKKPLKSYAYPPEKVLY